MKLNKWNYSSKEYDKIEVPDEWNVKSYAQSLKEIVNCPHCGKEVEVGQSYTSLEIHTDMGFGYCVCEKCYNKERLRKYGVHS